MSMTPTDYLEQSARTAAETFFPRRVSQEAWAELRFTAHEVALDLDRVKKGTFYDRHTNMEAADDELPIQVEDTDSFHAVLGVLTEGAELLELVDTGAPREKWLDEAGDVLWYLALLFRKHGLSFEEVMEKNIAKLRVRFPDKFETALANHRDEEAETLALKVCALG